MTVRPPTRRENIVDAVTCAIALLGVMVVLLIAIQTGRALL